MKVIVAGSRDITDEGIVLRAIAAAHKKGIVITELVCGMARGVDRIAYDWAKENGIPVKEMPADWDDLTTPPVRIRTDAAGRQYNAAAGPARNQRMADYTGPGGGCVAVWNGDPKSGTADMIRRANAGKLLVHVERA